MPAESVSLKDYLDARLADRDDALRAALASLNERLNGMNEFRSTLKDQAGTYMTRSEVYSLTAVVGVVAGIIGAALGHFVK